MEEFSVGRKDVGTVAVVMPQGEVDVYTAPRLKEQLVAALDEGYTRIVIDLSETSFLDSSGLGVLVGALKRANDAGGALRIVCPGEGIMRIFRITGLTKVFDMDEDLDKALELIGGQ